MNTSPVLFTLPAELHLEIQAHLTYPDLLAVRHTHPYFLDSLQPTIIDRVNWLLSRTELGLPIPTAAKLNLKTDAQFCQNEEVRNILLHRRRHEECKEFNGGTCLLLRSSKCSGEALGRRRKRFGMGNVETEMRRSKWLTVRFQMFVLVLAGAIAAAVGLPLLLRLSWLTLGIGLKVASCCG